MRHRRLHLVVGITLALGIAVGVGVSVELLRPSPSSVQERDLDAAAPSPDPDTGLSVPPRADRPASPGIVRPEEFGAVADGETDDGAALQRAFDEANGRPVVLSPGTYRSDRRLLLPSHTTLRGPRSATLEFTWTRPSEGEPGGGFYIGNEDQEDGNEDIVMEGFTIRGAGDGLPAGPHREGDTDWPVPAVRLRAVNTFVLRDLDIGYAPAGAIIYAGTVHGLIEGNHVHDAGRDGITGFTLQQLLADVIVRDNLIERVGDDAIAVAGSTTRSANVGVRPTGISIADNTIVGWESNPNGLALGRGVALLAVSDVEVRGNRIRNTASAGILVRGSPNPDSIDPDTGKPWRSSRVRITDNTIVAAASLQTGSELGPTSSDHGIEVEDSDIVTVRGNTVDGSRGDPFVVSDCAECTVTDAVD